MLNGKVRNLAVTGIAIASAMALSALGTAPAYASSPSYKLIVNSGETALDVTANGVGEGVTISNSGKNNNWTLFVNTQNWSVGGAVVEAMEIQHAGTDNCISYLQGAFTIAGCAKGDKNELFWMDPTGSVTDGYTNQWFINEGATDDADGYYIFMTASAYTNGAIVLADVAGFGGLAAWNVHCSANC
jgi:hypothetical protein